MNDVENTISDENSYNEDNPYQIRNRKGSSC